MYNSLVTQFEGIDRYMAEINKYPLLSREDEYNLARRYHEFGDVVAAHQLVVANLRFVVKIANEYKHYGLRLLDLIQEGNVGLMVAVKKFDVAKGYRLISYAVWWIRAYMHSFIMKSWSLVRLGTSRAQRRLFYKLRTEIAKLAENKADSHDTASQISQLAAELGVDAADITEMQLRLGKRDFSLDTKLHQDSEVSHLDMLPTQAPNQEETLSKEQELGVLRQSVLKVKTHLNDKECYIVENRLLPDDEEAQTLEKIGQNFGITRERVRQLENRTIAKLRAAYTELSHSK